MSKLNEKKDIITEESKLDFFLQLITNVVKSKLLPEEFIYLSILYFEKYELLYEYFSELFKLIGEYPINREQVQSLYEKGLISTIWKSTYPDDPILTNAGKKIVESIYEISPNSITIKQEEIEKFGNELIDAYPDYFVSKGQFFPTKGFSSTPTFKGKLIVGKYQLMLHYYELINGDAELHKSIIDKINKSKLLNNVDNSGTVVPQIRTTLMKFVVNKMWEFIKSDINQAGRNKII
jgi:hypothetical protein